MKRVRASKRRSEIWSETESEAASSLQTFSEQKEQPGGRTPDTVYSPDGQDSRSLGANNPRKLKPREKPAKASRLQEKIRASQEKDKAAVDRYIRSSQAHYRHREIVNEKNSRTLRYQDKLAKALGSQGKHEEAETLHRFVVQGYEETFGKEYQGTLKSLNHLAKTLHNSGQYEAAEEIYLETLLRCDKVLGRENRNTLMALGNLAFLLGQRKRYADAKALYLSAYTRQQETLGANHHYTLMTLWNYHEMMALASKAHDKDSRHFQKRHAFQRPADKILVSRHPPPHRVSYAQSMKTIARTTRFDKRKVPRIDDEIQAGEGAETFEDIDSTGPAAAETGLSHKHRVEMVRKLSEALMESLPNMFFNDTPHLPMRNRLSTLLKDYFTTMMQDALVQSRSHAAEQITCFEMILLNYLSELLRVPHQWKGISKSIQKLQVRLKAAMARNWLFHKKAAEGKVRSEIKLSLPISIRLAMSMKRKITR